VKRIVVAVTAALSAAALTVVAPPALSAGVTTITFTVTGCEGCQITPVWAIQGQDPVTFATTTVVDGSAFAAVPTSLTQGMSFNITAPWKVRIDAEPVIVTQYQGVAPGTTVTKAMAKKAPKATGCWAGTTDKAVALTVVVRRVTMPSFPDESKKARVPLAWIQPTAETTGGFAVTQKGVIAQQEAWYCPAG
jgi:hypothetical protein